MIILYDIILRPDDSSANEAFSNVEKSIEIFESMNKVVVARECAKLTIDLLEIARERRRRAHPVIGDNYRQEDSYAGESHSPEGTGYHTYTHAEREQNLQEFEQNRRDITGDILANESLGWLDGFGTFQDFNFDLLDPLDAATSTPISMLQSPGRILEPSLSYSKRPSIL